MIKYIFLIILFLQMNHLEAGDKVGNGGDAIVCGNKVRLLDYFEAEKLGLEIALSEANNHIEYALDLVSKLEFFDKKRAYRLKRWVLDFSKEARFTDEKILDIYDAGKIIELPSNCTVQQLAIQRPIGVVTGARYTIFRPLWNKLTLQDKAGLILHEVIYREALQEGHLNSENTRVFLMNVSSIDFPDFTKEEYLSLLRDNEFQGYGNPNYLKRFYEYYLANIEGMTLSSEEKVKQINKDGTVSSTQKETTYGKAYIYGDHIEFEINNVIKTTLWERDDEGKRIKPIRLKNRKFSVKQTVTFIKSTNQFKLLRLSNEISSLKSVEKTSSGYIEFYKDGSIGWMYESIGVHDYKDKQNETLVPGVKVVISLFKIKNKKLFRDDRVQITVVNPLSMKKVRVLEDFVVRNQKIN